MIFLRIPDEDYNDDTESKACNEWNNKKVPLKGEW